MEETNETPPCKTHPDAPHGFDRNASHNADRYVCECEGWEPVDDVNMSQERVDETDKFNHITVVCHKDHDKGYEDYVGKCLLCEVERLQKREWVGLTEKDKDELVESLPDFYSVEDVIAAVAAKLKEKNA